MFGEGKDEVGNIMNQECRIMFREIRKKRNKIEDSAAEELLQNSRRESSRHEIPSTTLAFTPAKMAAKSAIRYVNPIEANGRFIVLPPKTVFIETYPQAEPGPNPRFQPRFFANAAPAAKPVAVMDSSYKQITANQRLSNDGSGRCHPPP